MTLAALASAPRPATSPARDRLWTQTFSGRAWDLMDPRPADVHWPDIAEHLGKLCRYTGGTQTHYSVAQHCIVVAEQLPPDWRAYGLLHDAHEALLGDLSHPVKAAMDALGAGDAWTRLEAATDAALYTSVGLAWPVPMEVRASVHMADMRALATEVRDLLAVPRRPWQPLPDPLRARITPWPWPRAVEEYIQALRVYVPAAIG